MAGGPTLNIQAEKNLTLSKQTHLGPWLHPGSTGWVYSPSKDRIFLKTTRVYSLFPTTNKTRQNESSILHKNRGKPYFLAPHWITKHQNRKSQQLHSQMFGHRHQKFSQTPTNRTSHMATIIQNKLTGGTTHNQGNNRGFRNCSQQRFFQGIMGYISSDNGRK